MPYDTTNVASDQYTLQDVFARVKNYLGKEVTTNPRLSDGNIINAISMRILEIYNLAYDILRNQFTEDETGMSVSAGEVDLSLLVRVKEVLAVTYEASHKTYLPAENRKHFNEAQDVGNGSETAGARLFIHLPAQKKILMAVGAGVTGESTVTVTYVRTPQARFTLAEKDDTDNYIDMRDEFIAFVVTGAAFDLSAEQREQINPQLQSDYTNVIMQLEQQYGINESRRKAQNKD